MRVVKGNQGQQSPQGQTDPNMQVKVALKDTQDVSCEECGHKLFVQLMMFKKLSAILSPTGEESLIPVQVFACNDCGHVNKQFLPPASE
tara:strand:- start:5920 stop:6186 length:267 start_codon:yes stop_codon:yes gene_type:complete